MDLESQVVSKSERKGPDESQIGDVSSCQGSNHVHSHGETHAHSHGQTHTHEDDHSHSHGETNLSSDNEMDSGCSFDDSVRKMHSAVEHNKAKRQLLLVTIFCVVFMIGEVTFLVFITSKIFCAKFVGGYLANSVAIMSDAAHLLSDVIGSL